LYYTNLQLLGLVVTDKNILNVYQKRKTREIIKFVLNLTYLYYTNLQLLGLVVSDKNIFKCLPEKYKHVRFNTNLIISLVSRFW
jgi:hypothetical protein